MDREEQSFNIKKKPLLPLDINDEEGIEEHLKKLHELHFMNLPDDTKDSIEEDFSQLLSGPDTLEDSQQSNSSIFSGPVLPHNLLEHADCEPLVLECDEDTQDQNSLQEYLNSLSPVPTQLPNCNTLRETFVEVDPNQEFQQSSPLPQSSSNWENISENVRDFVDEYWIMKYQQLTS